MLKRVYLFNPEAGMKNDVIPRDNLIEQGHIGLIRNLTDQHSGGLVVHPDHLSGNSQTHKL